MDSSRGKKYKKVGDPVEIMVHPSNTYQKVVAKCTEALANQIADDVGGPYKFMKAGGQDCRSFTAV